MAKKAKQKLPILDPKDVLTLEKTATGAITKVLLGGEPVPIQMLKDLKHEASKLSTFKLWKVFQETIKSQAYSTMFEKSETFEDMRTGKTMLYNLSVQKNIVDMLMNITIKEEEKPKP